MLKIQIKFLLFLIFFSFNAFCSAQSELPWVEIKNQSQWPAFEALTKEEKTKLISALDESLKYLSRKSSHLHFPKSGITHDRTLRSIRRFKVLLENCKSTQELNRKLKDEFVLYKSVGKKEKKGVLFTGYFEPIYSGSLTQTATYQYPLYKRPPDLILDRHNKVKGRKRADGSVVKGYWSRQDIDEKKVLEGQNLELVYLDNPYDVYLAQFQGSVAVKLDDGRLKRYGYHARNCPTVGFSLAQEMLKTQKFNRVEVLPSNIATYFYQHPNELSFYLKKNPSYVFFVERPVGPMGALSVRLEQERAISTDNRLFPKGAIAFVDLKLYKNKKNHPFKKFVLNQDTGGAVIGPGRCEIFFGTGDHAKDKASDMFSLGQLYFLFLKE